MNGLDDPDFGGKTEKLGKTAAETPPLRAWTVACAVNLPFPLWMGWILCSDSGRVGMVFGVVVVHWLGRRLCFASPRAMREVSHGGSFVAALQLFPILQILAGAIGVEFVTKLALAQPGDLNHVDTLPGGFLATLTTASVLIVFAGAFGAVRYGLRRASRLTTEG